jgi:hypothetical protein
MKQLFPVALVLLCCMGISCGGGSPLQPWPDSRLVVFVHWDDTGLADKRLEVVELGIVKITDASGLAVFPLPAGTYTLRAYDINMGGPGREFVDRTVTTRRGDTTRVEVADCLPCVAPARNG